MSELGGLVDSGKDRAIQANLEVFSNTEALRDIARFVKTGAYPREDKS